MSAKESWDGKKMKMQLDLVQILAHLGRLMVGWQERA